VPELDDDAALALRLQEEEWGVRAPAAAGPADGGAGAAARDFDDFHTDSPDVYGRRARREQDRAYEESLAADRKREAAAAAEREAAATAEREAAREKAREEAAAAQAAKEEAASLAAKEAAAARWAAKAEPEGGLRLAVRLPDGSRLERRFEPNERVADLFDFCSSSSPALALDAPLAASFGFPRKTLKRFASSDALGLAEAGVESGAVLLTVIARE